MSNTNSFTKPKRYQHVYCKHPCRWHKALNPKKKKGRKYQTHSLSYAKINMKSKAFEPCCFEMESGSWGNSWGLPLWKEFTFSSLWRNSASICAKCLWRPPIDSRRVGIFFLPGEKESVKSAVALPFYFVLFLPGWQYKPQSDLCAGDIPQSTTPG